MTKFPTILLTYLQIEFITKVIKALIMIFLTIFLLKFLVKLILADFPINNNLDEIISDKYISFLIIQEL